MREASFILPIETGLLALESISAHRYVYQQLLEAFGGFTNNKVEGVWRNDAGKNVNDESMRYVVAILDGIQQFSRFREIALQAGRMLHQEAVYIVGPTGDAEIVSLINVGKKIIQSDVAQRIAENECGDKPAPRRPQVGDFWETKDGSKVYVQGCIEATGTLAVVFVVSAVSKRNGYVTGTDGRYTSLSGASHPLDLKRFIGR